MQEMLREAQRNRYAVGYFESWNLESTQAVIEAAEELRSPVIIGFNGGLLAGHGRDLTYYVAVGKAAVEKATVPAVLLLNEASGFQQIVQGIRLGFSCVMIDGSSLPFDENVDLTRKVAEVAHASGLFVEGQLDKLPHAEDGLFLGQVGEALMTDPNRAAQFVRDTGVDALSVSVGNIHCLYEREARIDLERLSEIRDLVDIPLVMHGATGIRDDSIKKAIELGVCKVNLGTQLRLGFTKGIKEALENRRLIDPEDILAAAEQEMKNLIKSKMKVYGCVARAQS
jgi:ketose-bisphosphate aldolase